MTITKYLEYHGAVVALLIISIFLSIVLWCYVNQTHILIIEKNTLAKERSELIEMFYNYQFKRNVLSIPFPAKKITPEVKELFDVKEMKVTAYCPCEKCCGQYSDGVTAIGKDALTKGVAVDPRYISYGTTIDIPGYGKVKADDCGGAIKDDHMDVRFQSHQEALEWGVQYLEVRIYRN